MPASRAAFPLPPPPPAPGLRVRSLGVFWGIADGLWAAPGLVARTLADLPSAVRRVPEALLDLGISALLLGFRRPAATLSLILLAIGGPIAAAAAAPLFRDIKATAFTGPRLQSASKPAPNRDLASRPAPPAPPEVASQLAALDPGFPRAVGIAVMDVQTGWIASVQGERPFPQQSVSKLWVALTVMDAVDAGRLSLDQAVTLTDADRSVFSQPITHLIENGVYQTSVGDLVQRALIQSDNAANDKLLALSGGPAAVQTFLASRGMSGIRLAEDQRQLQSRIAGLVWSPELSSYGAFEAARARLDPEARAASLAAYVENPYDGATPAAVVRALAALQRGELLSEASTRFVLDTLSRTSTGPTRLRGGLAPGWHAAHKTGTGQDFRGETFGLNDVGLVTAPDGRTYAVAVFAPQVPKASPDRLQVFQKVSSTIVEHWRGGQAPAFDPGSTTRAD